MPAQKRSLPGNLDDEEDSSLHHQSHTKQSGNEDGQLEEAEADTTQMEEQQPEPEQEQEQQKQDPDEQDQQAQQLQAKEEDEDGDGDGEDEDDSDGSQSSTSQEKPEYVFVELPEIRKDVQCPICLGIIKKTRTVMECLHRFCRECIDKSMRLGNNECPACRTHCASRRSLRDDPNYDALIAALYPDIDKYEEQELAFHEEERTRNKQIQASIAQVLQRQSEALVKRRSLRKESSAGGFITRSQRHHLSSHPRRRRNSSGAEHQGSEDNENDDNGGKDSSSTDERCTEVRQRRRKRRTGIRMSLPSSSAVNSDGGYVQNDAEVSRDCRGISPGLVWNPDLLAWGRGGARSHTRHGNSGSGSSKSSRARLNRLVEYLRSLEENDAELDVHLKLISVDEHSTSSLHQPYLCCRPSLSVKQLYEYIALQTPLRAEEVEILMVKGPYRTNENCANLSEDALQVLEGQETLAGLKVKRTSGMNHLILAYRQRQSS
ncbi:putative E3 ubiquitin-protein ligase RING1b [Hibiscus syriacus]|uniref:E3 ubiquitin-protein ligase RING1b n=1 Tax=Hibiscus syriacus TaxID=106335 RepID=A0A6A2XPX9_HIBSY|nr:putative E3 ubiquitin-protein ligase RING1a isoform X1 [Hibiscus syriacus]KAE8664076.1 putative E3 ubiquitin-protein ligase RING1b [Hibiscus syriacus]